jgi:hypothetical protein
MEDRLLQRSGLAEAGVSGANIVEGAATGTSLSLPYCGYLLSVHMDAVTLAAEEDRDQPQLNVYTVFAKTWHADSLARLSDADLANLWRLADYLMLDEACLKCLEDVVVQRQARTGIANTLLCDRPPSLLTAALTGVTAYVLLYATATLTGVPARVFFIRQRLTSPRVSNNLPDYDRVALGLQPPHSRYLMSEAAFWGHVGLIRQARAAGVGWDACVPAHAAAGGHLRLLQFLRQEGCPWDSGTCALAIIGQHPTMAIWALENGAPTERSWLSKAARWGCLPVLQWAHARGRLPADAVAELKSRANDGSHAAVLAWLEQLEPARGELAV